MPEFLIRLNIGREMAWIEDSEIDNYSIIVSATVLESFPKRFTNTILKTKKPFIVDPYTHIFGYNVPELRDKRWFSKLMGYYGIDLIVSPDATQIPLNQLLDSKKLPTDNLKSFVENVMDYQRNRIQSSYDEISEFEEFEGSSNTSNVLIPKYIISPYFYLGYDSDSWIQVNVHCIKTAVSLKQNGEKIFAVILIDKTILSMSQDVDKIIENYNIEGVDGYFIWVTDFDEKTARPSELASFRRLVEKLSKLQKPIYNMYGGLFSFLLHRDGLSGTCHSICYGEHKDPFLIGGMLANVRYYQPMIRSKIPYSRRYEIEKTLDLINCNCEYCKELPKAVDNIGKQMELCGKHFLLTRANEVEQIDHASNTILAEMKTVYEKSKKLDRIKAYDSFYDQLNSWNDVFGHNTTLESA